MPAPSPHREPTADELQAVAAEWLARRDAGLNSDGRAKFYGWLNASPRHAAAWREIESGWRAFDATLKRGHASRMIRELATRRRRRLRRSVAVVSTTVALAAAASWIFVVGPSPDSPSQVTGLSSSSAVLSKPERRVLDDGSVVELNTGAELKIAFSAARRDVRLIRGEAHFAVAKDAARPFVVAAGPTEVRAIGTAFAVQMAARGIDVLVTEGKVTVDREPAAPASNPTLVAAGREVLVPAGAPTDVPLQSELVAPAEIERRLAWRAPRLELSDTPLSEVIALLNRENRVQLSFADAPLAGLRLSGALRADRPEDFVRLLESHYGVSVDRPNPDSVVLRRVR